MAPQQPVPEAPSLQMQPQMGTIEDPLARSESVPRSSPTYDRRRLASSTRTLTTAPASIDGRRQPISSLSEANKYDELFEEMSTMRKTIAEERRQRLTMEDRLGVCQRQCEEERETRLALERELRAGIEACAHAQRAETAVQEKANIQIQEIQRSHTDMGSDFSDQQSSMHMMMDMLESAVDGKEAREMTTVCDEKIAHVRTELQETLDRMAADLADHLDSKLAEALQVGATAIEAIETLEERLNNTTATNHETIESLQITFDDNISEMATALETRIVELTERLQNSSAECLDQIARLADETENITNAMREDIAQLMAQDMESLKSSLAENEARSDQGIADLANKVDSEMANVVEQIDSSITTLGSSIELSLAEMKSKDTELEEMLKTTAARLLRTLDDTTGRLGEGMDEKLIMLKTGADSLKSDFDQVQLAVQTSDQHTTTSLKLVDGQFAEAFASLRDLNGRVDTDIASNIQRIEREHASSERSLITRIDAILASAKRSQEANEATTVHLRQEMQESIGVVAGEVNAVNAELSGAVCTVETSFKDELDQVSETFKCLCLSLAKDLDSKTETLDQEIRTLVDTAVMETNTTFEGLSNRFNDHSETMSAHVNELLREMEATRASHHEALGSVKSELYDAHRTMHSAFSDRHSTFEDRHSAMEGMHAATTAEVRDAIEQLRQLVETAQSKQTTQINHRIDEVQSGLSSKIEASRASFEDVYSKQGALCDHLKASIDNVSLHLDQFRGAMTHKLDAMADGLERSTDAKIKNAHELLDESTNELSKLRQQLHKTDDVMNEKVDRVVAANKAHVDAQAVVWQKQLESLDKVQTQRAQEVKAAVVAEMKAMSASLQSSAVEQQLWNDSCTAKMAKFDEAAQTVALEIANNKVHLEAQAQAASNDIRQRFDSERNTSDRQHREGLGDIAAKLQLQEINLQKSTAERLGEMEQQLASSNEVHRHKLQDVQTELGDAQLQLRDMVHEKNSEVLSAISAKGSNIEDSFAAKLKESDSQLQHVRDLIQEQQAGNAKSVTTIRLELESRVAAVSTVVAEQISAVKEAMANSERTLRSEAKLAAEKLTAQSAGSLGRVRTDVEAMLAADIVPLRESTASLETRLATVSTELTQRIEDAATTLQRQTVDQCAKLEIQLNRAEGDLRTLTDGSARQQTALQQQIVTAVSAQDTRVQQLRVHVQERSDRLEQQSEWCGNSNLLRNTYGGTPALTILAP
jgi:hypothetical protein